MVQKVKQTTPMCSFVGMGLTFFVFIIKIRTDSKFTHQKGPKGEYKRNKRQKTVDQKKKGQKTRKRVTFWNRNSMNQEVSLSPSPNFQALLYLPMHIYISITTTLPSQNTSTPSIQIRESHPLFIIFFFVDPKFSKSQS